MLSSMALYMEFNKGGVEEIIDDPLILSLNEIIQKNSMKGQLASHHSIWLEICVELLLRYVTKI
jgi:hypothetical protein